MLLVIKFKRNDEKERLIDEIIGFGSQEKSLAKVSSEQGKVLRYSTFTEPCFHRCLPLLKQK